MRAFAPDLSIAEIPHAKAPRRSEDKKSQFFAPLRLCVGILLCLLCGSARSADEPSLTPTQIARLESLCRVWGTVKFFHPWIVAPPDGKPIDWDAALIEAIPLVEKAETAQEFSAAVDHLLSALSDRATRAWSPSKDHAETTRNPPVPALPPAKFVTAFGKKVLLIDATDWRAMAAHQRKSPGELFVKAFADAGEADAVVLDLRRQADLSDLPLDDPDASLVNASLRENLATMLKTDLTLAAMRTRFHSGYAPEQGGTSGGYHSGFEMTEPGILTAKPGPAAGKRMVLLTNAGTRFGHMIFAALQLSGQAAIVHHANGQQPFAPGSTYQMQLADGVVARLRTADSINADGTFGLVPDITIENPNDSPDDLMASALAIATGEKTPPPRSPKRLPATPFRMTENIYPDMKTPNREYRLLGLFRVWNVMHYFFPYKHLMDRSWDSILTEFIPRFAEAETPMQYAAAAREFVAHLQDSHVVAYGGPANLLAVRFGGISPLVSVRPMRGELVVVAIGDSLKDKIRMGDTILEIAGEPVAARMDRLSKYDATSTPQAGLRRFAGNALRGHSGSPVNLKLRDRSGSVREETVPRPLGSPEAAAELRALAEWTKPKTPVFGVLPDGYGYFDLVRLKVPEVNTAFDAVKDTPALIMDMRGYPQGTAWAICSRLTEKPMTMATFRRHYWTSPSGSEDRWAFDQRIQPSPLWKYSKPIVVLINEDAISQSEHSCLGFEEAAKGRITFIGTPTTGANGDVTNTSMPGGIRISFSGHDVRHADGRQLQRVGIQPDIRVEPTIEGLVAGKDEVLDAAIKFLNESKPK